MSRGVYFRRPPPLPPREVVPQQADVKDEQVVGDHEYEECSGHSPTALPNRKLTHTNAGSPAVEPRCDSPLRALRKEVIQPEVHVEVLLNQSGESERGTSPRPPEREDVAGAVHHQSEVTSPETTSVGCGPEGSSQPELGPEVAKLGPRKTVLCDEHTQTDEIPSQETRSIGVDASEPRVTCTRLMMEGVDYSESFRIFVDSIVEGDPAVFLDFRQRDIKIPTTTSCSWFIPTQVGGREFFLLCDTGSAVTLLRKTVYDSIDNVHKSKLVTTTAGLQGASGERIRVHGICVVELELGGFPMLCRAVVADVTCDGIVGTNFLEHYRCVLDMASGKLQLPHGTLFMSKGCKPSTCRVSLSSEVTIPGRCQMVLDCHVKGVRRMTCPVSVIEPPAAVSSRYGILVGRSLVNTDSRVPVLLLNPGKTSVFIPRGGNIALLRSVSFIQADNAGHVAKVVDPLAAEPNVTFVNRRGGENTLNVNPLNVERLEPVLHAAHPVDSGSPKSCTPVGSGTLKPCTPECASLHTPTLARQERVSQAPPVEAGLSNKRRGQAFLHVPPESAGVFTDCALTQASAAPVAAGLSNNSQGQADSYVPPGSAGTSPDHAPTMVHSPGESPGFSTLRCPADAVREVAQPRQTPQSLNRHVKQPRECSLSGENNMFARNSLDSSHVSVKSHVHPSLDSIGKDRAHAPGSVNPCLNSCSGNPSSRLGALSGHVHPSLDPIGCSPPRAGGVGPMGTCSLLHSVNSCTETCSLISGVGSCHAVFSPDIEVIEVIGPPVCKTLYARPVVTEPSVKTWSSGPGVSTVCSPDQIAETRNGVDSEPTSGFAVAGSRPFGLGKTCTETDRLLWHQFLRKRSIAIPPQNEGNSNDDYRATGSSSSDSSNTVTDSDFESVSSDSLRAVEPETIKPVEVRTTTSFREIAATTVTRVMRTRWLNGLGESVDLPEFLADLVPDTLPLEHQFTLARTIDEHRTAFSDEHGTLGKTSVTRHEIDTGDHAPIRQRLRRLGFAQQEIVDVEIAKMLGAGVIERSESPWASPVVLVRKKDGSIRFCIDFRELNDITKKDAYPLPNIEDAISTLAGSEYFCTLDLAAGYWQVEMSQEAKQKTSFCTRNGLYQFNVMPFGLSNAPATFERLMELVLKGLTWSQCVVYIDDIIVFGKDFSECHLRLVEVFKRLQGAHLRLKPKKCKLFRSSTLYLGYVVSGHGIETDPEKIGPVKTWPAPCTLKQLRSFIGLASYHRKFIPNFSEVAEPLYELLQKQASFNWGARQAAAFAELKRLLITAPVLVHPLPEGEFLLDTDASLTGIGGALYQMQDGEERLISYASKTLGKTQRNYCTTRRELLAVVRMVEHFRHYLWGRRFRVRTDHSSLRWLLNFKNADGMISRWISRLAEFDMEISFRSGKSHQNADALSRMRCRGCPRPDCPDKGVTQYSDECSASTDDLLTPPLGDTGPQGTVTQIKQMEVNIPPVGYVGPETGPLIPFNMSVCIDPPVPCSHLETHCCPRVREVSNETRYYTDVSVQLGPLLMPGTSGWTGHVDCSAVTSNDRKRIDEDLPLKWFYGRSWEELRDAQLADRDIKRVYELKRDTHDCPNLVSRGKESAEVQTLLAQWSKLTFHRGILYRQAGPRDYDPVKGIKYVVPKAFRLDILHLLHDLQLSGHAGIQGTVNRVKEAFYWPSLTEDVARWVGSCPACVSRKGPPHKRRTPLESMLIGVPFDRIGMDVLDARHTSKRGNKVIIVIVDYFSKWSIAVARRNHTASTCAEVILKHFICQFGTPSSILTDQGPEFESHLFKELCALLRIEKLRTSSYHPQTDGLVERQNRTLISMISKFVNDKLSDWDDLLPYLLMAYNTTVHNSTGCTPFSMIYGREACLPVDLLYPIKQERGSRGTTLCGPEYVENLRNSISSSHEYAREKLERSSAHQKRNYDVRVKPRHTFNVGDIVRYFYPRMRVANKFAKQWIGPYIILSQKTDVDFEIKGNLKSGREDIRTVHKDNLIHFEQDRETLFAHYQAHESEDERPPSTRGRRKSKTFKSGQGILPPLRTDQGNLFGPLSEANDRRTADPPDLEINFDDSLSMGESPIDCEDLEAELSDKFRSSKKQSALRASDLWQHRPDTPELTSSFTEQSETGVGNPLPPPRVPPLNIYSRPSRIRRNVFRYGFD